MSKSSSIDTPISEPNHPSPPASRRTLWIAIVVTTLWIVALILTALLSANPNG